MHCNGKFCIHLICPPIISFSLCIQNIIIYVLVSDTVTLYSFSNSLSIHSYGVKSNGISINVRKLSSKMQVVCDSCHRYHAFSLKYGSDSMQCMNRCHRVRGCFWCGNPRYFPTSPLLLRVFHQFHRSGWYPEALHFLPGSALLQGYPRVLSGIVSMDGRRIPARSRFQ